MFEVGPDLCPGLSWATRQLGEKPGFGIAQKPGLSGDGDITLPGNHRTPSGRVGSPPGLAWRENLTLAGTETPPDQGKDRGFYR